MTIHDADDVGPLDFSGIEHAKAPAWCWADGPDYFGGVAKMLEEHGDLIAQIRWIFPDATAMQVALMVGAVCQTCAGCHDAPNGSCYCGRDD